MLESKKIKIALIFIFFTLLLLLTIASMDLVHTYNCHEKDCKRCETIHNSVGVLNSLKSSIITIFIPIILLFVIDKLVEKKPIKEVLSPVKLKVVLIE